MLRGLSSSGPSQNDLFVLGKAEDGLVSITVEGKVAESFDLTVSEWLKDASKGKRERLSFLCHKLVLTEEAVLPVRYQLLHRTVSALLMAEKLDAKNALMMVHSFSESNEWFDDFEVFSSLFGVESNLNRIHQVDAMREESHCSWLG